jgi:hypothetical protein
MPSCRALQVLLCCCCEQHIPPALVFDDMLLQVLKGVRIQQLKASTALPLARCMRTLKVRTTNALQMYYCTLFVSGHTDGNISN